MKDSCPLISILISTKNRKDELRQCLLSISRVNYPNYEIIINDNKSTDGTAEMVAEKFPEVNLIYSDIDKGAAGGKNVAVRSAKGKYCFFVDSDNIVHPEVLNELVKVISRDDAIGVVGSKIYYYSDKKRVWSAGADINLFTSKCFHWGGEIDHGQYDHLVDTGHFACAYMFRKSVLDEVGLFDEDYFIMYEESDLQIRVVRAGYRIVFVPSAIVWHDIVCVDDDTDPLRKLSLFSKTRAYYTARNRIVFMKKNGSIHHLMIFFPIFLPLFSIFYLAHILRSRRYEIFKSYLRGLSDGLRLKCS